MNDNRREFLKLALAAAAPASGSLSTLTIEAPISRWDDAIPIGNGLTGALLWGENETLRLSLDRGDLWDLRNPEIVSSKDWTWATIQKLVAAKNQPELVRMFDDPYDKNPYPTKVPAGRLEMTLDDGNRAQSFSLDLRTAVGRVAADKAAVEVFCSAAQPVIMIRVTGSAVRWRLLAPAAVARLGYPPAQENDEGETKWYLQKGAGSFAYGVVGASRRSGDAVEIAVAITSTRDAPDPVSEGRRRVEAALDSGYARLLPPHAGWWQRFWQQSRVEVPDRAVQLHYLLAQYFYGAASRRLAPPMPLQGVWTADDGNLPPWKGDYHHDLNTQLTYWAYLTAGHFDEGSAFLDLLWDLLPAHRRFARDFYDAPGAAVPGVMTLDGKPMGGWGQYALSPTAGAWLAQSFYLHWRYTMDRKFLLERAYPYCQAIGKCLKALLKPGPGGQLKLPLSTSPELFDNTLRAWLTPNTNHDQALLMWLFGALAEMAPAAGHGGDAAGWRDVLNRLGGLAVEGESGALRISPDLSLTTADRHHSHLMAIHPLGILHVEASARDRAIIDASLRQLDALGTKTWRGYSFVWLAAMQARVGLGDPALHNMRIYLDAFITRNGFHVGGDFQAKGYSDTNFRRVTLEGNFAAAQAVHEMLLQSWGGTVRVFPAVPGEWAEVSFEDLRAEGGFSVSARRTKGATASIGVRANQGGRLRLRDPFGGRKAVWSRRGVTRSGSDFERVMGPGEVLEAHLA